MLFCIVSPGASRSFEEKLVNDHFWFLGETVLVDIRSRILEKLPQILLARREGGRGRERGRGRGRGRRGERESYLVH